MGRVEIHGGALDQPWPDTDGTNPFKGVLTFALDLLTRGATESAWDKELFVGRPLVVGAAVTAAGLAGPGRPDRAV